MPQKELYLLQFAAIHMAELCAGAPKIMRCEVVELQTPGTPPDYIQDDVFGYPAKRAHVIRLEERTGE